MVAQLAVNQLVAGSNPASGAKIKFRPSWSVFYFDFGSGSELATFCVTKNSRRFGEARKGSENLFSTLFERRSPKGDIRSDIRPEPRLKISVIMSSWKNSKNRLL